MKSIFLLALSMLSAYIIGSFPTSFILAKIFKGVDIRQTGSKNAGATNVLRVAGKVPALITLVVDILKGFIVVTLVADFFYYFGIDLDYDFYRSLEGLIVISGHIWSVFLNFKGGKGVATTVGVGLALAPGILAPSLVIWAAVFILTKFISLASIIALMSFPVAAVLAGRSVSIIFLGVIICLISTYKHKENIKRLLEGKEPKTFIFKKKAG